MDSVPFLQLTALWMARPPCTLLPGKIMNQRPISLSENIPSFSNCKSVLEIRILHGIQPIIAVH